MKNLISYCRTVCITLAALIILLVLPQTVYADSGGFTYTSNDNCITITGYSGSDSKLAIPATIDGQVVTGISSNAFLSDTKLISVVIPDSVLTIGDTAFNNCTNLVSARFMGNAPSLGTDVFSNCSSDFKVYYEEGKTGYSNPWNSYGAEAYIAVTGINLDKSSATLTAGSTLKLEPALSPANATNKNVIWTSNNPSAAEVDNLGNIKAINEGTAIIKATAEDGGFEAACTITVVQVPGAAANILDLPVNYDKIKIFWSQVSGAAGYELYRSDSVSGTYSIITDTQLNEFIDSGLNTGTAYYYKVRAYKVAGGSKVYSDFTQIINAKTLDKTIGSALYLYMSVLSNRNSVFARAVQLHYGIASNTCALTASEALRRIGIDIPLSTCTTNVIASELAARGWTMYMNLNLLQPGDICFTTDVYGHLTGGHATHTFIFMGWANNEKNLMYICDNQASIYGSVLHTRTIAKTELTDATAYFYHTNISSVSLIPKVPGSVRSSAISYNRVRITWAAASNASGYEIYRSTSKYGTYTKIAATGYTNFTDSNLATGTTYYYKVRAYKISGTAKNYGGYSYISSARPALSAPYSVRASALRGRKAKISWRRVSGASGYEVFRSTTKYGRYSRIGSTGAASYTNSRLTKGRYYYYKVRAYRYVGKTKVYSSFSIIKCVRAR